LPYAIPKDHLCLPTFNQAQVCPGSWGFHGAKLSVSLALKVPYCSLPL
jgi:hypothetical protein